MGRITDGLFNQYGKGRDQIDIARENRLKNPNGSHTVLGVMLSQYLPQMLAGGMNMYAESSQRDEAPETDTTVTRITDTPEGKAVFDAVKKLNDENKKTKTDLQKVNKYKKALDDALTQYYTLHKYGDSHAIDTIANTNGWADGQKTS